MKVLYVSMTHEQTEESAKIISYEIVDGDGELVKSGNDIESMIKYLASIVPCRVYCHNLNFYGEFIIYWLMTNEYKYTMEKPTGKEFTSLISSEGNIYNINISARNTKKGRNAILCIQDSEKLIPINIDELPKAFGIDPNLSPAVILSQAVGKMLQQGFFKRTIGSNALAMLKEMTLGYDRLFPDITEIDSYLREAYGGAFLYCNPKIKDIEITEGGVSLDINSLYPYVLDTYDMPFGYPIHFEGNYNENVTDTAKKYYPLYVQRFEASFELKEGKFPIIQDKDVFNTTQYIYETGMEPMELTLTSVELELFLETYEIYNIRYIDGYMFQAKKDMFKNYIDYWRNLKEEADKTGNKAQRKIAKLFLNNIGGKFATKLQFQSRYPIIDFDGAITYRKNPVRNVEGVYLPVACFMISYAKIYLIRIAEKCYDRFLYSDTDSLHIKGREIPDFIPIHPTKFGCFKIEHYFIKGKYLHAKCYAEITDDGEVKTAISGLPKEIQQKINYEDFHTGKSVDGKLIPFNVPGGAKLVPARYTL